MTISLATPLPSVPVNDAPIGEVRYPSLYLEGSAELLNLPEDGVLTIKVHRVHRSEDTRGGEPRARVEYEVHEIVSHEGVDSEKPEEESAEKALKRIAKEVLGK
jgi:hypothetical protein